MSPPKISPDHEAVAALEKAAEQAVPGLADEPAWPTLRARLLLLAAAGTDPSHSC